jgi:hypothetical protein
MGYRSNVVAYFYVTMNDSTEPLFDRALTLLKLWWTEGEHARAIGEAWGSYVEVTERGVLLRCDDVKWYEDYTDIKLFNEAVKQFRKTFIDNDELDGGSGINKLFCYEFARTGEDYDDNENETDGYGCEYRLSINRSIEVN